MKKMLIAALAVPLLGLTACGGPSFEDECKEAGHIYKDKSESDMKYVFSATDGKFHWVLVTTTTRLCLSEKDGSVLDVEVS